MVIARAARTASFNEWAKAQDWPARCDPELNFESENLAGLLAVWRALACEGKIPLRRQMTMRLLKPHLRDIAIFERVCEHPKRYHVRLSGSRLSELLGNLQGRLLEEAVSVELARRWHALLDLTLDEVRPLRFTNRIAYKGREHLQAEALHLPLSELGPPPTMVLVCALFKPNTARDGILPPFGI